MKSEWRVSSNYVCGEKYYQVYRLRDTKETDHSGNREFYGHPTEDKNAAAALAKKLNDKEDKENEK